MDAELFPSSLPVVATVLRQPGGEAWLAGLPGLVSELRERWSLRLGAPFHGGSCSWVAPAWLADGAPAVLKVTWPHREAAGEAEGLRLWDGHGAVRLYREDRANYALLVERCEPGVLLSETQGLDASERLLVGARLLNELWSVPPPARTGLERVGDVTAEWADLLEERMERLKPGFDPGLVAHGARLLRELPRTAEREVVVHGDFNPGNVLAAQRLPWLAIDAKPMIGDPGYDPSPLLSQIDDPFAHADPRRVLADRIALVAEALGESFRRLAAWATAREVELALWAVEREDPRLAGEAMAKAPVLAGLAGL
jgi:streptomycin 6-kinase